VLKLFRSVIAFFFSSAAFDSSDNQLFTVYKSQETNYFNSHCEQCRLLLVEPDETTIPAGSQPGDAIPAEEYEHEIMAVWPYNISKRIWNTCHAHFFPMLAAFNQQSFMNKDSMF
jgi:hypothetical protein